jgi:hypothetical protein
MIWKAETPEGRGGTGRERSRLVETIEPASVSGAASQGELGYYCWCDQSLNHWLRNLR